MDVANFIELRGFVSEWKKAGLDENDLAALRLMIMSDPERAPVMVGTGGLRKIRFAPRQWRMGKRGAVRVCYVYFASYSIVLLVTVFAKNEKDDLSQKERRMIKSTIKEIAKKLAQGPIG